MASRQYDVRWVAQLEMGEAQSCLDGFWDGASLSARVGGTQDANGKGERADPRRAPLSSFLETPQARDPAQPLRRQEVQRQRNLGPDRRVGPRRGRLHPPNRLQPFPLRLWRPEPPRSRAPA